MTFDEWHREKAKYMEPKDIVHWCAAAFEAGAAAEREACAKVCDNLMYKDNPYDRWEGMKWCADAIRARGQNV